MIGNFLVDFLETLVILSAILLPTKSPVASAVSCIALLEAVLIASVADFLAVSTFFSVFITHTSSKRHESISFFSISLGSIEYLNFIRYLITIARFILCPISNSLLF